MTADDQRTTNTARRVGEEGRGLGRVPISGVDASGVTEGMGGNTVKGRSQITGADAEENVSVYPSGMREMMSAATRRTIHLLREESKRLTLATVQEQLLKPLQQSLQMSTLS